MKYADLITNLSIYGGDFFREMDDDYLQSEFPWIAAQKGKLQPPKWHPEGDAFVHTCLVIDRCVRLGGNDVEIFCAMTHDLGKGITPDEMLPHHYDHESTGVPLVHEFCDAVGAPANARSAAWRCCKYHLKIHKFDVLKTRTRVRLINNLGDYVECVTFVSQCDAQGRGPDYLNVPYPQREMVNNTAREMNNVTLPGVAIGNDQRVEAFLVRFLDDAGLGKKKK